METVLTVKYMQLSDPGLLLVHKRGWSFHILLPGAARSYGSCVTMTWNRLAQMYWIKTTLNNMVLMFSLNFSQIDGIGRQERLSHSMNFAFLGFLVKRQKKLTVAFEFSVSYTKLTMLSIKVYVGKRKEITFSYLQ